MADFTQQIINALLVTCLWFL